MPKCFLPKNNFPRTALDILVGPAGSGKTEHCINSIITQMHEGSADTSLPILFLAPTIEHVQRLRTILCGRPDFEGSFTVRIHSLNDILRESMVLYTKTQPISDLVKQHILRDLIRTCGFSYYDQAAILESFVETLALCIADLKSRQISPRHLATVGAQVTLPTAFRAKLTDIAAVYAAYEAYLHTHLLSDSEDLFCRMLMHVPANGPYTYAMVCIDGFFDFSQQQRAFLTVLARMTPRLMITITTSRVPERAELFSVSNTTVDGLIRLFPDAVIHASEDCKRAYAPELKRIGMTMFYEKELPPVVPEKTASVVVAARKNTRDEIRWIADMIKQRIVDGGCAFSDIAVLFRLCDTYVADIESVFSEYGIPCTIHERKRMSANVRIKACINCMQMISSNFSVDSVIVHLKSSFTPYVYDDVCRFEHLLMTEGVQGTSLLDESMSTHTMMPPGLADMIQRLFAYRELFAGDASVADNNKNLMTVLVAEGILSAVSPDRITADERDALCRLDALFHEMEETFPQMLSGSAYLELFLRMIDFSLYSSSAETVNAVQVYNVSNAKQKEYKVVFLAGVGEGLFPLTMREDILLTDAERKLLGAAGISLDLYEHRLYAEKYLFYLAFTRALEQVYISYPSFDSSGRALLPSSYLMELQRVSNGQLTWISYDESQFIPSLARTMTVGDLEKRMCLDAAHAQWTPVHETIKQHVFSSWPDAGVPVPAVPTDTVTDTRVITELATISGKRLSASQLEVYAQCPFKYFLVYGLKLKPWRDFFDPAEQGTIMHAILERFYHEMIVQKVPKHEWLIMRAPELAKVRIREIAEEYLSQIAIPGRGRLAVEVKITSIMRMLDAFVDAEREIETERSTVPMACEYAFGIERGLQAHPVYRIVYPDGYSLQFCGVLDRIDGIPGKSTAVIIDYKGTRTVCADDIVSGRELQLLLYKCYAEEELKLSIAGVELYPLAYLKRSGVYVAGLFDTLGMQKTWKKIFDRTVWTAGEEKFRQRIRSYVERIRKGDIRIIPETCAHCEYTHICRCEPWRATMCAAQHTMDRYD